MSKKKPIYFVTNNQEKIADIKEMIGEKFVVDFISEIELIEKQSLSVEEVVSFKAQQAFEKVHSPIVVSDSGLEIVALKNFPGALVKFVNETIGQEGLVKLLSDHNNRTAFFVAAIAYCDSQKEVNVFVEKDEGTISIKPLGEGWHFDRIFIPKGENRTWAQIGREMKNTNSAFRRALVRLALFLEERKY